MPDHRRYKRAGGRQDGTGTDAAAPTQALRLYGVSACGRSPGLRAKAMLAFRSTPSHAYAQWRVWIALLAYRCGGSSGMAARTAHRIPVSTIGVKSSGGHLRPQHLRGCSWDRLVRRLRFYTEIAHRDNDARYPALGVYMNFRSAPRRIQTTADSGGMTVTACQACIFPSGLLDAQSSVDAERRCL
jgi:hypothetical protein